MQSMKQIIAISQAISNFYIAECIRSSFNIKPYQQIKLIHKIYVLVLVFDNSDIILTKKEVTYAGLLFYPLANIT